MARKKKSKGLKFNIDLGLEEETRHGIIGILFFVIGIFLIFAGIGKGGFVGTKVYDFFKLLLGVGYVLLPALSLILGVSYFRAGTANVAVTNVIGSLLFFLSGLGFVELLFSEQGGIIGRFIASPLMTLFDFWLSLVILVAVFIISLIIIFNTKPRLPSLDTIFFWRRWQRKEHAYDDTYYEEDYEVEEPEEEPEEEIEEDYEDEEPEEEPKEKKGFKALFGGKKKEPLSDDELPPPPITEYVGTPYTPPPLSIFNKDKGKPGVGDIKANANVIKRTFQNFGIDVEMDEISVGPSVTRYAFKPAEGVRLSRIVGLQKNLELALAATPVRIEAPIPGKSLVGIEVPNTAKTTVGLGTLLGTGDFQNATTPLLFSLGRDVSGSAHFANVAKMPHMLVAGATGAGKSVTLHTIIASLLFRNAPQNLKFVMVDPKRVELTLYNGIPHLLTPVITEPKKAILALKWLINEMERRYNVLEEHSARDIQSYHANILSPALEALDDVDDDEQREEAIPETMPYIIVIIDELADIMSTYPRELEAGIVRLAQMSRAVGIHLILSTQRPSVNVITGLIKANIPGRLALQVASQVDSRTILDMAGAEKLLGAGDMLFMSGSMSKPIRVQSAFISEDEVKKLAKHLRKHHDEDLEPELELAIAGDVSVGGNSSGFSDDDEDELYEDAREAIIDAGKASTSYLQRKLRVGYARAARLMDMLEERGVIGPADGSKPREVLVDIEQEDDEE